MIPFCLLSLIHLRILGSAADLPDSMLLDQELHENPSVLYMPFIK